LNTLSDKILKHAHKKERSLREQLLQTPSKRDSFNAYDILDNIKDNLFKRIFETVYEDLHVLPEDIDVINSLTKESISGVVLHLGDVEMDMKSFDVGDLSFIKNVSVSVQAYCDKRLDSLELTYDYVWKYENGAEGQYTVKKTEDISSTQHSALFNFSKGLYGR